MGGAAVMEAAVMATLQRLGTNATGGTYPPVKVPLLDLGSGGEYPTFLYFVERKLK